MIEKDIGGKIGKFAVIFFKICYKFMGLNKTKIGSESEA
jgi:hypothetical protein